jgi:nicotinamide phosphoribosyltransferase
MNKNIITLTDSYKLSHAKQYPPNTSKIYSYFESRVGAKFDTTVFFGLQYILKEYLEGQVVTKEKIDQAEKLVNAHVCPEIFNRAGWEHILYRYQGRLPIKINAVPEGTVVPVSNVMMTVENTDPNLWWLTNYIETLLVQVWYPSTVATQSREMKKIILHYLEMTGDPGLINFKLHDFGFRGVSSVESAGLGGAAHLVNFMGTDTIAGLEVARDYYGCEMAGFSIPASEHSTITSWGKEHEVDAMRNMLETYPKGLVACVSDSWNIFNACTNIWGEELKEMVLARDGCLVVRPDSGEPTYIVPKVLEALDAAFGSEKNKKGYKVLNPKVRVIQGDGVEFSTLPEILKAVTDAGYSADNIAFGSGGGLLQKLNRDTQRFAFKCSAARVNGEWRDVYKQPSSDSTKNSKPGILKLVKTDTGYITVTDKYAVNLPNALRLVYWDGTVTEHQKFEDVRKRAAV